VVEGEGASSMVEGGGLALSSLMVVALVLSFAVEEEVALPTCMCA